MLVGTNKRGDQVKIKSTTSGGYTLSLVAKNGTGWAEPAHTLSEAKAKAEKVLGPLCWNEE